MSFLTCFRFAQGAAFVGLTFAGVRAAEAPAVPVYQSNIALTASEKEAIEVFESRIKDYIVRHKKLEKTLPKLSKKATPEECHEHQRALGVLIQTARAGTARGEFFTPGMLPVVTRTLAAVLAGPDGKTIKASIMYNNPEMPDLKVNDRYPDERPLPGMPPAVLKSLPKLEEELEYRFIGERLILMDANAHIVLDFTDDVLP